jgi:general secretion pathway protein G
MNRIPTPPRVHAGFTLLELMIVLLILGLIATLAAPQLMKQFGKAKHQTARIQVDALAAAVDYFQLDLGRYPTAEEGLKILVEAPADVPGWDGPYLRKAESLVDPWGAPYLYRTPGKKGPFDVYSLGADRKEGGDKEDRDVGNW